MNWWQTFTDSFEMKGAQIFLLWVTDLLFVAVLIFYAKDLDPIVMSTVTGLVGGVNGAFLGAMGARQQKDLPSPLSSNVPPPSAAPAVVAARATDK
jgi:hypothetical protein